MRSIKIFLIIFFIFRYTSGYCQSPYRLSSPRDFILPVSSAGVSITGYILSENKKKLTVDEISELNKENINAFDRSAASRYSIFAERTSDVLMFSSIAIPFALLLDKNILNHSLKTGVIYFETIAIASVGINLSKGLVRRPRPYVYNPSVPVRAKQKTDATRSFFSGHTTTAAASAFFAAKVYCDNNPGSKFKPVIWISAAALPLATGYYRYRAGKHFPTDVIIGYCWGALSGILIPQLHRQTKVN